MADKKKTPEEEKKGKRKGSALKRFLVKRTGAKAVTDAIGGKAGSSFVPETAPKGVTLTGGGQARLDARNAAGRAKHERDKKSKSQPK